MSVYVDNFLLIANSMKLLNKLKKLLANEDDIKDLEEFKMIIGLHVMRDMAIGTMMID